MRAPSVFPLSLRHLLIALTALGLLPLALLGVWGLYVANDYRQKEETRSMLDLARALSSAVETELDASHAALTSLSQDQAFSERDIPKLYELARRHAAARPEWLDVVLTDAQGTILFRTSAPYGQPGSAMDDPASVHLALASDRPVVGQTVSGPNGQFAFPMRIGRADASGGGLVLGAVIQPERILRVLQRQNVPDSSVIAIINSYGTLIARSRNAQSTVGKPPSPTLSALIKRSGSEGIGTTMTLEGNEATTAVSRLARYEWVVAIGVPKSAVSPMVWPGLTSYGIGVALSLALCIGLATFLAGRIVDAFRQLQAGTVALGAGQAVHVNRSWIAEIEFMNAALATASAQAIAHEQERSSLLISLEEALVRQESALQEARSASRVKDEFLAVLGHELRNPLSPIVGSLDLMDLRNDPASARERTVMRRQVNHLRRLVDDLLDASRISSGKLTISMAVVNLAELVRDTAASFDARSLLLTTAEQAYVNGDESRLVQVLHNLLSNAVRFSKEAITVELETSNGSAILTVSDRGIGMPPELLSQVFEPFFQAPQLLARATGGLGLGLAIVRKIVELHGGTVRAHSEGPGRGSSFTVTLPLVKPGAALADAVEEPAPVCAGTEVLLVDDNEDAAATTSTLLREIGCQVRVAHSAREALALFKSVPAAVAILDIGLPDMDGYALASALRALGGGAELRLIALTGYAQASDIHFAYQSGFHHHLAKPTTAADLQRALAL